jgi:hypothetical protein
MCAVRAVELNQLTRDIAQKQTEVDNCNPQQAQQRKVAAFIETTRKYVVQNQDELEGANANYRSKRATVQKLASAAAPLKTYLASLKDDHDRLMKRLTEHEQVGRRERRRFLDSDPQSGVSGPAGVRTADDKVMLTFWICYGAAILTVAFVALRMYGITDVGTVAQTLALVAALAYGIAYFTIIKLT